MSFKILWYGPRVLDVINSELTKRMDKAAIFLQGEIVGSFGSPVAYPTGGAYKATYGRKFRRMTQKEWRRSQHSRPGDTPFVQTGHLRRSITWKAVGLLTRLVGSFMPQKRGERNYASCLEYGTSTMAARPFLRPALHKNQKKIYSIIASGV